MHPFLLHSEQRLYPRGYYFWQLYTRWHRLPFRGEYGTCILADVTRAATYHPHTHSPLLPICIPYGEPQARIGAPERHDDRPANRQCGIKEIFRHGARGREGRHAVRTRREWPASNSGVQRRLRLQKCKALRVSFLFAPASIFVHVCRRCQRADRAGGFHVGLIFCNFSIKRKVKDYNFLID